MSELPEGWAEVPISQICDLRYGKNLPTKELSETGYPVFGANGQIGFYSEYHFDEPQVLITCRGATCGTINRSLPKSFVTNNSIVIKPFDLNAVDDRFLELFLKSTRTDGVITGSAQPQITLDNLQHLRVRLAPLNEQKRIVAKLDELLPRLEACKERLQKIPAILKRFRQSVLAAAVSGKLTEEWRKGKSIEDSGWQQTIISDVIIDKPRNGFSPHGCQHKTAVKVLTLTATTSGVFDPEQFKYVDESIRIDDKFWLKPGDVLVQRGNTLEYVGVSAIYEGNEKEFIYPDLMMRLRPNDKITKFFLWLCLSAETARQYMRERATGTSGNMPKINQETLMSVPLMLPSINEQRVIEVIVKRLLDVFERTNKSVLVNLGQIQRTSDAILSKAFSGTLVPQDPNDEPASALLERIRAENRDIGQPKRAGQGTKKRGTRKTTTNRPKKTATKKSDLPLNV